MSITLKPAQLKILKSKTPAAENLAMEIKFRADGGNVEDQFNFAYCCYQGYGVEKNINKYVEYLKLAVDNNSLIACLYLGHYYETRNKLDSDFQTALSYYRMAALQGNEDARRYLLELYRLDPPCFYPGRRNAEYAIKLEQQEKNPKIYTKSMHNKRPSRWVLLSPEELKSVHEGVKQNNPLDLNELGVDMIERSFAPSLSNEKCRALQQKGIEYITRAANLGDMSALYNYVHYALLHGIYSDVNLKAAYNILSIVEKHGIAYATTKKREVKELIDWIQNKARMSVIIDVQQGFDILKELMNKELNNSKNVSTNSLQQTQLENVVVPMSDIDDDANDTKEFIEQSTQGVNSADSKYPKEQNAQQLSRVSLSNDPAYKALSKDHAYKRILEDPEVDEADIKDLILSFRSTTPFVDDNKPLRTKSRGPACLNDNYGKKSKNAESKYSKDSEVPLSASASSQLQLSTVNPPQLLKPGTPISTTTAQPQMASPNAPSTMQTPVQKPMPQRSKSCIPTDHRNKPLDMTAARQTRFNILTKQMPTSSSNTTHNKLGSALNITQAWSSSNAQTHNQTFQAMSPSTNAQTPTPTSQTSPSSTLADMEITVDVPTIPPVISRQGDILSTISSSPESEVSDGDELMTVVMDSPQTTSIELKKVIEHAWSPSQHLSPPTQSPINSLVSPQQGTTPGFFATSTPAPLIYSQTVNKDNIPNSFGDLDKQKPSEENRKHSHKAEKEVSQKRVIRLKKPYSKSSTEN